VRLCIYGEGIERKLLENYIETKQLAHSFLKGNQNKEIIQKYQESHFVILPSAMKAGQSYCRRYVLGCVPFN
jgi:hypothetical protein